MANKESKVADAAGAGTADAVAVPLTADAVAVPIKTAADFSDEELAAVVDFRDKAFTSRALIMPGGRQLQVSKGRVQVKALDVHALAFLDGHADLERLLE